MKNLKKRTLQLSRPFKLELPIKNKGSSSNKSSFIPFLSERDHMGRLLGNKNVKKDKMSNRNSKISSKSNQKDKIYYRNNEELVYNEYDFPVIHNIDEIEMHPEKSDLKLNKMFKTQDPRGKI